MTSSVLVVIVSYRSAALALRCLETLASEARHPELELSVVVVDNASGDAPELRRGIDECFSHLARLVVSPVNGGFGAGNNLGLRSAHEAGLRPDYVHFLNPDTEVREGAVLSLARFLAAHPRAGLASGRFEHQDGTPWTIAFRFPSILGELESGAGTGAVSRLLARHVVARTMGLEPERIGWCSGASMMLRREVLETVGGFDEGFFLYFEEVDLCARMDEAGWERWYVPESRVMHIRGRSTGVTTLGARPSRLPAYWFESRTRYLVKRHGSPYAVLADAAFLLGRAVGTLRDRARGESPTPHLAQDVLRHSALWRARRAEMVPPHGYVFRPASPRLRTLRSPSELPRPRERRARTLRKRALHENATAPWTGTLPRRDCPVRVQRHPWHRRCQCRRQCRRQSRRCQCRRQRRCRGERGRHPLERRGPRRAGGRLSVGRVRRSLGAPLRSGDARPSRGRDCLCREPP
jgi:N-acetylglucosaminyl-diphospho-decaprenol L-rhamnosyltransferase